MQYRKLPHGGEQIGVLGLGSSAIGQAGDKEIEATVAMALENGVNYFDMASGDAAPFAPYGRAVAAAGMRDKVYFQIHFGAEYTTGKYGWTLDLDAIKRSVDWQLTRLKTDYIDFGFIHCIDEESDYAKARAAGTIDYILELKRQGVVRHIGMSSHTPAVVNRVLDEGLLDMLMFSINPAYDYQQGEYAAGAVDERMALYRRCEAEGVGISVMKAFAGGQLLDAKRSPFGLALDRYQCIRYALDRPGVLTVLPGVRDRADLQALLGYFDAPAEQTDYSAPRRGPQGGRGRLRLLQPLRALPHGAGRGADQQILRSSQHGRRACRGALPHAGKARLRLRGLRPLRQPLPLPRAPGAAHAADRGVFRAVIRPEEPDTQQKHKGGRPQGARLCVCGLYAADGRSLMPRPARRRPGSVPKIRPAPPRPARCGTSRTP